MDVRAKLTEHYHLTYAKQQLLQYDNEKGYFKQLYDLEHVAKLRHFLENLPNQKNRDFTIPELFQFWTILDTAKTTPGHLSHDLFTELKNRFNHDFKTAIRSLKNQGILSEENFTLVVKHPNHVSMASAILHLNHNQLDTRQNRDLLVQAKDPDQLAHKIDAEAAIDELFKKLKIDRADYQQTISQHYDLVQLRDLLEQLDLSDDVRAVLDHRQPIKMAAAFVFLKRFSVIDTEEVRMKAKKMEDPEGFVKRVYAKYYIWKMMQRTELETNENYYRVNNYDRDILALSDAMWELGTLQFKQPNFDLVRKHVNPVSMAKAIRLYQEKSARITFEEFYASQQTEDPEQHLHKILARQDIEALLETKKLNDLTNRTSLIGHPNLVLLKQAVVFLNNAELLDDKNFKRVQKHPNTMSMAIGITILSYLGWALSEDMSQTLDSVEQEDDPQAVVLAVLGAKLLGFVKNSNLLKYFINLVGSFFETDLLDKLNEMVNEALEGSINFSQNTRVASVSQSASQSATALLATYGCKLSFTKDQEDIQHWANSLSQRKTEENTLRLEAAQSMINKILNNTKYNYIDPISKIALKKLIFLCWHAIGDTEKLRCDKDEAERLFIEALYESERGYNLDKNGTDDGSSDNQTISLLGIWNKLMEKLAVVHPDVNIVFVTRVNASWKLPCVVKEEVFKFLGYPRNQHELEFSYIMLEKMEKEKLGPIWENIKTKVTDRIFAEFGSLYKGRQDPDFIALVMAGKDTAFDKMDELRDLIQRSPASRDNISNANLNAPTALFGSPKEHRIDIKPAPASPRLV